MGDGLTLYDLVADRAHVGDTVGCDTDDARLAAILGSLHPDEREVAVARAQSGVKSWAEAALIAEAADPVAAGERVRRKLKRLAARQQQLTAEAAITRTGAS
ncbi:hypothetical protein JG491_33550 [Streptomyces sp. CRPSP2-6A1]|uniref:hypothetical protein n=1 Tax=Streptomyces TaxID=1883 RepID=UPI0018F0842D|nr:hypothetical protein [Streptomyces sp. CRPSP2-6A1]MBJ7004931.1 hypothetical protein [Streptomyces sp. CRPSP2-6A1]